MTAIDRLVAAAKAWLARAERDGWIRAPTFADEETALALAVRALDAAPEKPAEFTEPSQAPTNYEERIALLESRSFTANARLDKIEKEIGAGITPESPVHLHERVRALESRLAKEPAGISECCPVCGVRASHGHSCPRPAPPPSDPSGAGMTLVERWRRFRAACDPFMGPKEMDAFVFEIRAARVEALEEARNAGVPVIDGAHDRGFDYAAGWLAGINAKAGAIHRLMLGDGSKLRSAIEEARKGDAT